MCIERFCRQIETRSKELGSVMPLLIGQRAWIMAGSVLRMQVESVIRAVYLLNDPPEVRLRRVERSFDEDADGRFPKLSGSGYVSDRKMARLADEKVPRLRGSASDIYHLGCKLVHLSKAHEYEYIDPYRDLPVDHRRKQVLEPLFAVWGSGGITIESSFAEVMEYAAPRTLRKLTELANASVIRLRGGESLDPPLGMPNFS